MIKIKVKDTDGSEKDLKFEANSSTSLMEVLVENDFDVPAVCGGMANCGTCHVQFHVGYDKLPKMEDIETFMVESLPNVTDQSRLSCQCNLTDALNGAEIEVLSDGA